MEINEAIMLAKQCKQKFAAFEKMEDLLRAVAAAGGLQDKLTAEVENLKIKKSDLENTLKELEPQISALSQKRDELAKEVEASRKAADAELQAQISDAKNKLAEATRVEEEALEIFKAKAAERKEAMRLELVAKQEEVELVKEEHQKAIEEFEAFKQRLK